MLYDFRSVSVYVLQCFCREHEREHTNTNGIHHQSFIIIIIIIVTLDENRQGLPARCGREFERNENADAQYLYRPRAKLLQKAFCLAMPCYIGR